MADNRGQKRRPRRAFSIGFLTALVSDELVHCEDVLKSSGWNEIPARQGHIDAGISAWEKSINGNVVTAFSMAIDNMGQAASAIETYAFLSRCNPTELFMVGIAGSLQKEWVFRRDVVVGKSIHWQTQNGVSGDGPCDDYRPCPHILPAYDPDLVKTFSGKLAREYINQARHSEADGQIHTHYGPIFTWDYVVNSERVVQRILGDIPGALCVEMEGGGFLAAIARYAKIRGNKEILGFVVRGISDYASAKTWDVTVRRDASRNAMKVAIDLAEWRAARYLLPTFENQ